MFAKYINPHSRLLFLVLCTILCCGINATAQELDEVLRSMNDENNRFKKAEDKPVKDPWINSDSSLAKIFTREGKGVLIVMEWLGDYVQSEFRLKNKQYKKQDEYIQLSVTYTSKANNTELLLTFLIPHPRYIDLVNTGLVKAFSSLEPPGLSTIASEKLVLKNSECQFYHHKGQGCSILYKLPKSALLNIYDKSCTDAHATIQLAELLSIDRLKEKLES